MRRRKRSFRNCWIAIRASPGGAATRCASRAMVPGRGSHRPEEQPDPGVGANRQPAGGTEGPRLCLGLCVWCGLPVGGQSGGADHADLQYPRDEPSSPRDQQPSRRRCPCRGDLGSCWLAQEPRHWWCRAISLCWSCRPIARSSIRSSGFGTICAAIGSPTRCFPAWRTSWMPARSAWNRFANNHGLVRSLCAVAWAPALPAL